MKILHVGNVGTAYVIVRELRKRGIDSNLLIEKQQIEGLASINNPIKFDKGLDGSIPEWVNFYSTNEKNWKFNLLKKMRKYDLIHAYMGLPIYAMFSCKPYVAQSVGDDLRVIAFKKSVKGLLLRMAYRRAKTFIYEWPPHTSYVDQLKISNTMFIPKPWETSTFSKGKNEKTNGKTLTIFHPLGQDWHWKGNDKFLRAFARLCKEKADIFLYYVDWGKDSEKAKKIIDTPDVKERIKILPGPISREEMTNFMEISDLVADQFNSGSFTRTGIESMFFGIPMILNLNEEIFLKLFGDIPSAINAKNEDDIYYKLKELISSKDNLIEMGQKTKIWAQKHYNLKNNIERYIQVYTNILKK